MLKKEINLTSSLKIVWLIEHIARELDVACAVKAWCRKMYNTEVIVKHLYMHQRQLIEMDAPDIVVFPFFYKSNDPAVAPYLKAWPDTTVFNMSWEELYYNANTSIKAPGDDFTKTKVIHHAWGEFFRKYLVKHGVDGKKVVVNGQPAYQLYKEPYRRYYTNRTDLARKYKIDHSSQWIFIPENYRWAYINDRRIDTLEKEGADRKTLLEMRSFCLESIEEVLRWCKVLLEKDAGSTVIFRPRPATNTALITSSVEKIFNKLPDRFRIIKEESVREWILASNIVVSSFSTSLIEAAIAEKNIFMAEPYPLPDSLYCDWYKWIPRIKTSEEFTRACSNAKENRNFTALQKWGTEEMLNNADPIRGLAEKIIAFGCGSGGKQRIITKGRYSTKWYDLCLFWMYKLNINARVAAKLINIPPNFNVKTHEMDFFTQHDIAQKTSRWDKVLEMHNVANSNLMGRK